MDMLPDIDRAKIVILHYHAFIPVRCRDAGLPSEDGNRKRQERL